jgi:hypothetical protein
VQVIEQPAVSVGLEKDLTTLIDEYR